MKIETTYRKFSIIEINRLEYSAKEIWDWESAKSDYLMRIIRGRPFCLFTESLHKQSVLYDFGTPLQQKLHGEKYYYLKLTDFSDFASLAEESDFYLGQIFLLIGDLTIEDIDGFHFYLSYGGGNKYSPLEFIYIENDGNTLNWVNPNDAKSFMQTNQK